MSYIVILMSFTAISPSIGHGWTDEDNYIFKYIENNTWVRGNTRFISNVEHDISRVSAYYIKDSL
jgi:hypothetical protein